MLIRTRRFIPSTASYRLNLIPLVDVVFQLIVFFMVTAHVITVEQEPMQLPQPPESQARQKPHLDRLVINLFVDPEGKVAKIKVNAQVVKDLSELVELVLRLGPSVQAKGTHVILRADRAIQFAEIQPVLRALSNASVGSLEIATAGTKPAVEPEGRRP